MKVGGENVSVRAVTQRGEHNSPEISRMGDRTQGGAKTLPRMDGDKDPISPAASAYVELRG